MIGKLATSKAGHDKLQTYVIVGEDKDYVYLSDGRLKPLESPKKKRKKHIQIINTCVEENLAERLVNHQRVLNEEIKHAIKSYRKTAN